jgi:antitoxin ParD1/3/4
MNISLTRELEEFVREKVETGRYLSASEVVREALRLLEERDQLRSIQFEEFRKDVADGLAQLDAGDAKPLDVEDIKARGRTLLAEKNKRKRA